MIKEQREIFLTPKETADAIHVSLLTLCKWRKSGIGPPFSKIGRRILYRQSALERFVRRNQVCPINEQQITKTEV